MHKFWVSISAVILVALTLSTNAATNCANTTLEPGEADAILKLVNAARDKLRRGEQRNGFTGYNLPAAASMPDLKWECSYEKQAVASIEQYCKDPYAWNSPAEAITIPGGSAKVDALYQLNFYLKAMDFVELESVKNGSATGGKVLFNGNIDLLGYATLANGAATSIACAHHKCVVHGTQGETHFLQCRTDKATVNKNQALYQAVTDPNACPSNAYMNNSVRKAFLNKHNNLRILLATGVVQNGNTGKMLEQAKKMPRLVYDCGLEKTAYERAKLCEKFDQSKAHPFKENYFNYTVRLDREAKKAARVATQRWWSAMSKSNGIDEFRNLYYGNQNIRSFAKIASDLTTKIGCAIYNCTNLVNVVCHYDTTLGHGASLYEPGSMCSGCSGNCSNGLCEATVPGATI